MHNVKERNFHVNPQNVTNIYIYIYISSYLLTLVAVSTSSTSKLVPFIHVSSRTLTSETLAIIPYTLTLLFTTRRCNHSDKLLIYFFTRFIPAAQFESLIWNKARIYCLTLLEL